MIKIRIVKIVFQNLLQSSGNGAVVAGSIFITLSDPTHVVPLSVGPPIGHSYFGFVVVLDVVVGVVLVIAGVVGGVVLGGGVVKQASDTGASILAPVTKPNDPNLNRKTCFLLTPRQETVSSVLRVCDCRCCCTAGMPKDDKRY